MADGGGLVVWRCKGCGYLAAHPITDKHPRMNLIGKCGGEVERIPVIEASKYEELVAAARLAANECYAIFSGVEPPGVPWEDYEAMAHNAFSALRAALDGTMERT